MHTYWLLDVKSRTDSINDQIIPKLSNKDNEELDKKDDKIVENKIVDNNLNINESNAQSKDEIGIKEPSNNL